METKNGFSLINTEKLDRALNGFQLPDASRKGGVGDGAFFDTDEQVWKKDGETLSEEATATLETALLAEYDRLGGLIRKNSDKVKTGSFYDFKAKKPFETPRIVFTYRVNGAFVDVPEGTELPGEVKAAKILADQKAKESEEDEEAPKKKVRKIRK